MRILACLAWFVIWIPATVIMGARGFEVSDPGRGFANDRVVEGFECIGAFGGKVSSWKMHDHYAFLAQGCVMHIWDVANLANPQELSWVKFSSEINTISVKWPAVYVATTYKTVSVIDFTNPKTPRFIKKLDAGGSLELNAIVIGDLLIASEDGKYGQNYYLYNIQNPLQPKLVKKGRNYELREYATDGHRLFMFDEKLYSPDDHQVKLLQINVTDSPPSEKILARLEPDPSDEGYKFTIKGGQLVCTSNATSTTIPIMPVKGIRELRFNHEGADIRPQPTPLEQRRQACIKAIALRQDAYTFDEVKVADGKAYLMNEDGRLTILNVKDPTNSELLAQAKLPSKMAAMAIENGRVYLCDTSSTLHVLDITGQTTPTMQASLKLPAQPMKMSASGNRLFMAAGEGGMLVCDITQPDSPKVISTVKTSGKCRDVAISGTRAYLLADDILVVNLADLRNPITERKITLEKGDLDAGDDDGYKRTCYLKRLDNILLVVCMIRGGGGTHCEEKTIDLSRPEGKDNPKKIEFDTEDYDYGKENKGRPFAKLDSKYRGWYLCLPEQYHQSSGGQSGMIFLDVSDPMNPRPVGEYWRLSRDLDHQPLLFKDTIYIADGENGLLILRRRGAEKL